MLIKVKDASVKYGSKIILDNISFEIVEDRKYAIVGPSGSGKTTLLKMLAGLSYHSGIVETAPGITAALVEQQHQFKNLSNTATFYYQQRYNSADAEDAITVDEYLSQELSLYEKGKEDENVQRLLSLLQVDKLLQRRLIQLSNGENKRVQLVKALLLRPNVLLLDNAFVGLDQGARGTLTTILESLSMEGITIVLVASKAYMPHFITTVLKLDENGKLIEIEKSLFPSTESRKEGISSFNIDLLRQMLSNGADYSFEYAIKMNNVQVRYYDKQILKDVSWSVKRGDRWALSGPNGAGKSTLLSLINADNPQAYANEIFLFDKRRGRGESIWDIKSKIGFVSPELHLYFEPSATAFDVIASGFFDTIGLFRKLNDEQIETVNAWMQFLNINHLSSQLLKTFSLGQQRLILLARALIKNPPLLLLDEPAQGLDDEQALLFRTMVEAICDHSDKTLVYISHFKEEIPSCVTKFIHLENGGIKYKTE